MTNVVVRVGAELVVDTTDEMLVEPIVEEDASEEIPDEELSVEDDFEDDVLDEIVSVEEDDMKEVPDEEATVEEDTT